MVWETCLPQRAVQTQPPPVSAFILEKEQTSKQDEKDSYL